MKATEYIKTRLKDKGLNVERMSEIMGISIPTAYKYVRQPETMTLKMARKMSNTLGVDNLHLITVITNNYASWISI